LTFQSKPITSIVKGKALFQRRYKDQQFCSPLKFALAGISPEVFFGLKKQDLQSTLSQELCGSSLFNRRFIAGPIGCSCPNILAKQTLIEI
jgi:hypothetical protein